MLIYNLRTWKEYAGYLHDVEYLNMLKPIINGGKYLFGSWSTYGADIRLMARTLYLGLKHTSPLEMTVGSGLGVLNTSKVSYGWIIK